MKNTELCRLAVEATEMSYSPYSGCSVGAALLTAEGDVFSGCNIENGAFSPTVCAERLAIFKAVSEGKRNFVKLAVVCVKNGNIVSNFPPCGVCRQVMSEFCSPDFEILAVTGRDTYKKYTLSGLLPEAFGL